ncbi:uncharacterized protein LOC108049280 isoform X1 [Drosophila rhopaloa]|uniref:Uncharacterized protein n=1 Tax=Drosophila rhopaloa TaxID=1041015 RepID=A0ABM5HVA5_DRORH|nr:uncharacterized protein LOC108049280 isoform X1 [Drosophila rhopaloa]
MNKPNLLIVCATLALLHLEIGAARATGNGFNPALYTEARRFGLDEGILNEMWRTKKPWVNTKRSIDGTVTKETIWFSPNGEKLHWKTDTKLPVINNPVLTQIQDNLNILSNNIRNQLQTTFGLHSIYNNPFVNPVGFGFPDFNIFNNLNGNGQNNQFEVRELDSIPCYCQQSGTPNERSPGYIPNREEPRIKDRNHGYIPSREEPRMGDHNPGYMPRRESDDRQSFGGAPRVDSNTNDRNPIRPDDDNIWLPSFTTTTQRTFIPVPANAPATPAFQFDSQANNSDEPLWVPVPDPTTTQRSLVPLPTLAPKDGGADTSIDDYLAKVDITAADIADEDGMLVRTIVDEKGRVLNASFSLKTEEGRNVNSN